MAQNTADPRSDNMKIKMAEHFENFEHEYREDSDTHAEVVHEDDDCIIVADHTGHELNEWSDDFDVDRSALSEFFHDVARQKCDYSWSTADPVVFDQFEN